MINDILSKNLDKVDKRVLDFIICVVILIWAIGYLTGTIG